MTALEEWNEREFTDDEDCLEVGNRMRDELLAEAAKWQTKALKYAKRIDELLAEAENFKEPMLLLQRLIHSGIDADIKSKLYDDLETALAEVERLKCCGNCDAHHDSNGRCVREATVFIDRNVNAGDPCHFTPSRWQERKP